VSTASFRDPPTDRNRYIDFSEFEITTGGLRCHPRTMNHGVIERSSALYNTSTFTGV
jgi:hypothetical protein